MALKEAKVLEAGMRLYRRSFQGDTQPAHGMVCFSITEDYGSEESHGAVTTYTTTRPIRVFDLGDGRCRDWLRDQGLYMDPDYQYGGGGMNTQFHTDLRASIEGTHDGTILRIS